MADASKVSNLRRAFSVAAMAAMAVSGGAAFAQKAAKETDKEKKRKPDLGDAMEGAWFGNVGSDVKGSSKSDVTLTITRIGVNKVSIASDYARLPVTEVNLERVGKSVMNRGGNTTFLLETDKSPPRLYVTFQGEAAWIGQRKN
jgi:hypothetical protein